jgi:hypothetical protein
MWTCCCVLLLLCAHEQSVQAAAAAVAKAQTEWEAANVATIARAKAAATVSASS